MKMKDNEHCGYLPHMCSVYVRPLEILTGALQVDIIPLQEKEIKAQGGEATYSKAQSSNVRVTSRVRNECLGSLDSQASCLHLYWPITLSPSFSLVIAKQH